MVALEDAFQTRLDEKAFSGAHDVGQLRALVEEASKGRVRAPRDVGVPRLESITAGATGSPSRVARVHPTAHSPLRLDSRGRPSSTWRASKDR